MPGSGLPLRLGAREQQMMPLKPKISTTGSDLITKIWIVMINALSLRFFDYCDLYIFIFTETRIY